MIMTQDQFILELKQLHHSYKIRADFTNKYFQDNIKTIEHGPVTFENEEEFRQLARLSKDANNVAHEVLDWIDKYFSETQHTDISTEYGWQKTFKFRFDEIKSKCGFDNSRFSRLLLYYVVKDLKISRSEINESLDLLDSYIDEE